MHREIKALFRAYELAEEYQRLLCKRQACFARLMNVKFTRGAREEHIRAYKHYWEMETYYIRDQIRDLRAEYEKLIDKYPLVENFGLTYRIEDIIVYSK